jgi:hypothetical protein
VSFATLGAPAPGTPKVASNAPGLSFARRLTEIRPAESVTSGEVVMALGPLVGNVSTTGTPAATLPVVSRTSTTTGAGNGVLTKVDWPEPEIVVTLPGAAFVLVSANDAGGATPGVVASST